MRKPLLVLASSLFITLVACGGKDKPPKPPETDAIGATDGGTDMPPTGDTASTSTDAGATPTKDPGIPDPNSTPPSAAGVTLPKDTVKIALKGKKTASLELKSDGTVSNGGKAAAKITSTEVQDAGGKAVLSVSGDAVNTPSGTSVASFQGDDLVGAKGDKLSIGADGTLTWTTGGKGAPAGKAEGGSDAKRATLLAAWFVLSPPPADKPATPAKPAGKETPAKPTGKPAPKK